MKSKLVEEYGEVAETRLSLAHVELFASVAMERLVQREQKTLAATAREALERAADASPGDSRLRLAWWRAATVERYPPGPPDGEPTRERLAKLDLAELDREVLDVALRRGFPPSQAARAAVAVRKLRGGSPDAAQRELNRDTVALRRAHGTLWKQAERLAREMRQSAD